MFLFLPVELAALGYALWYLVYTSKKSGFKTALPLIIPEAALLALLLLLCYYRVNS